MKAMINEKELINIFVLNGPLLYFSISAILGFRADPESGAGISYKIYMVSLLLIGLYSWWRGFVQRGEYTVAEILPLFILFFYAVVGIIQGYANNPVYLQMVCFSFPAVCIALNMDGRDDLAIVMKWMDLLLLFFSFAFIFMIRNIFIAKMEDPTAYDQNASYMIAYCFLVDIFLLSHNKSYPKFSFLDKKWYRTLKILMLPYFLIMIFFGGGRGAFVTVLIGLAVVGLGKLRAINPRFVIKGLFGFIALVLVMLFVLGNIDEEYAALLNDNFGRIFSVIADGGLDTSASSGRDDIWLEAFRHIVDRPVFGYGIYSYLAVMNMHPHNIVLEILLQGGLVLLSIYIVFFVRLSSKYSIMCYDDEKQIWLAPFIIFTITELLFSASYMFEPFFWFSFSYIYNYRFLDYQQE